MKRNLIAVCLVLFAFATAHAEQRLIVVNGVAEKSLDPNLVNLGIEVWSKAATAKQAQQLAVTLFKQVKKSLEDFKIKKRRCAHRQLCFES